MLPLTMNGGPYIYDRDAKQFVMRPAAEPRRETLPDLPDEPVMPAPRIKPPLARERRRFIMWLMCAGLLLAWLILLNLWTRRISANMGTSRSRPDFLPEEFSREKLLK